MSVETPEFLEMCERMLRAAGRRVADADEIDLAQLAQLRDRVEDAIQAAVTGQRERGRSWDYIARGLGIKRQSAWERYRK